MLEEQLQRTVFAYIDLRAHQDDAWGYIYHVPNGGDRDARVGAKLKGQGVRRGVPDICVPIPRPADGSSPAYHGMYLELKCQDNPPTEHQLRYLNFLLQHGYCVQLIYDEPEAVIGLLEWYMGGIE